MSKFFEQIENSKNPYIIAEIGANHNGDMELAKKMIDSAKECGVSCVKFQSWDKSSLICKEEYNANTKYAGSKKKHFGSLEEMVEKYYLREEQHYELKEYCDKIGIDFSSTPFSNQEVDLLCDIGVDFIKVASMDINNIPLLKYLASKKLPVMLSTGMATLSEIETAVKTIEDEGNNEIILLHCVAVYPPKNEDINLNNITMLKNTFQYPIGFSDHTIGTSIPLASVVLGAKVIEKHFTLDKDMAGWDHEISANPKELKIIVEESKNIAESMGSFSRIVSKDEEDKKIKFRRSIVLVRSMKEGDVLQEKDLAYKRPGTHIAPNEYQYVVGRKLNRDISGDILLSWEDLV